MPRRYEIIEHLATGGMAEIYRARVVGTGGVERMVVVKRMLPSLTRDPKFTSMFLEEARLAAGLHHPNIVEVFDLGVSDEGEYFIAMEYVRGRDLGEMMDTAAQEGMQLGVAETIFLGRQVCAALDHAHRRLDPEGRPLALVHRDVSPHNVLVSFDGEVKLTDFGIARARNRRERTEAGWLKGKQGYMSPEQALGRPLDQRSDLFNVGILLHEMLAGERLFAGASEFSTLEAVRQAVVPRPGVARADVPPGLDLLIRKALARSPGDRFASAAELGEALAEVAMSHRLVAAEADLARAMRVLFGTPTEAPDPAQETEVFNVSRVMRLDPPRPAGTRPLQALPDPSEGVLPPEIEEASTVMEEGVLLAEMDLGGASVQESGLTMGIFPPGGTVAATRAGGPAVDTAAATRAERPSPAGLAETQIHEPTDSGLLSVPWEDDLYEPELSPDAVARAAALASTRAAPPPLPPPAESIELNLDEAELEALSSPSSPPLPSEVEAKDTIASPVLAPAPPRRRRGARLLLPLLLGALLGTAVLGFQWATKVPAARRPTPVAAAPLLLLESEPPGAKVEAGGQDVGRTPLSLPVEAGPVELVVRQPGFADWKQTIEVPAGARVHAVQAALRRHTGALFVRSVPAGAAVSVDGRGVGRTPLRIRRPQGAHRVEVTAPGHAPWSAILDLGARAVVRPRLLPLAQTGRLELVTWPAAEVETAGHAPSPAGAHPLLLAAGPTHRLRLRAPGLPVRELEVRLDPGEVLRLFVSLTPDPGG